jgi:transcriptional regulator with XRE-family HTH domain
MKSMLVKEWMKKEGIRQEQLALRLGISFRTLDTYFKYGRLGKPTIKLLEIFMGKPEGFLTANDDEGPKAA